MAGILGIGSLTVKEKQCAVDIVMLNTAGSVIWMH